MFGRFLIACFMIFIANSTFAIDPVKPTLDQAFPSQILVSAGSYVAQYSFRSQLPFTMVDPLVIVRQPSSDEFTFNDQCTGKKLAPQQSCTVQITLDAFTPGAKTVRLIIQGYDNNQVPLLLKTTAIANTAINIVGEVVTPLPANMTVNSTANYKFRFTNTGNADATGVSADANVIGFSTTCTSILKAGAFCELSGSFMPTSITPATQSVIATLDFAQGQPVSVQTSTQVTSATGLDGIVIQGLDTVTYQNTAHPVQFRFTNNSQAPISIGPYVNLFPPQCVPGSNNCPYNGILNAGASCDIFCTFNSAILGDFTVSARLSPTTPTPPEKTLSTSTQVVAQAAGRTISFLNQCPFPVWISLNGANRQNNGANIPCQNDSNCPAGSRCNPTAGTAGLCFWENYNPDDNNFQLAANVGSNSIFIPDPGNLGSGIFWSGAISASTGCMGNSCTTASCNNMGGTTSCQPGVGFSQPATQAEITMETSTVDTYDVEVINGFHIPIQITPDGALATGYNCGSPGDPTASADFSACRWNAAVVPDNNYYWVTSGGASCSNGSCPAGQLCGLDIGINKVCGRFLGFWTANQACGVNSTKANPYFNCNQVLPPPFPANTYTLSDLYACNTPDAAAPTLNSCYKAGANNQCCGCANWREVPFLITLPADTELCLSSNPTWGTNNLGTPNIVLNSIIWMKRACSGYYTYPYDDKSSTFTCTSGGTPNLQEYTVTFCQGSISGLPAGATEGRNG